MTRSERRHGFTLIELLVALVVGATVLLGARLLLDGVADDARRLSRLAGRADRDANAERLLRTTVGSIELSGAGVQPFGGDEREVRFTSWCESAGGWQERCPVVIAVAGDSGARALVLTLPGIEPLRVRSGLKRAELRYLVDAHAGGRWFRSWEPGFTAPLAIGVVLDGDTLVISLGDRG